MKTQTKEDKIFNLSEMIEEGEYDKQYILDVENVKEAVRLLKKELMGTREYKLQDCEFTCGEILEKIDSKFGDKLT